MSRSRGAASLASAVPDSHDPALSVVVVTPRGTNDIADTIRFLRAQTARHQMEIIVVGPDVEGVRTGVAPLEVFAAARPVTVNHLSSMGLGLAAGVRAAKAPVVVCAEEHSYPEPDWAAALVAAHDGPWAAVGGVLENANPGTYASWSALFACFGPAVAPAPGGEAAELPGHHTAYKREALARYDDQLERCLEVEWVMQEDMRLSGARLYLEPRAISSHMNESSVRSLVRSAYYGGRLFAGNRAWMRKWSARRRLLYTAAAPLLPIYRLLVVFRHVRFAQPRLKFKILPVLALRLTAEALGQAAGCALGAGAAPQRRLSFELNRQSHLAKRDRRRGRL
jgi:GT2 family glycosyltransferase